MFTISLRAASRFRCACSSVCVRHMRNHQKLKTYCRRIEEVAEQVLERLELLVDKIVARTLSDSARLVAAPSASARAEVWRRRELLVRSGGGRGGGGCNGGGCGGKGGCGGGGNGDSAGGGNGDSAGGGNADSAGGGNADSA
eukprot:2639356-Pleurochrysis_carterae.AAC.1